MLVSNQSVSQSWLWQVVKQTVIQSVSQSFNQLFDHSIIHYIKRRAHNIIYVNGTGDQNDFRFFPLRFLEAPTPLRYNLGWCYFPPPSFHLPQMCTKYQTARPPKPPPPLLHHHHHANDENGLQKYCLKHIDSQKHFLVHKSPIDNVFLHPCPFSTIFRKRVVRIVLMVRS